MTLLVGNLATNDAAESAISVANADIYHSNRGNDVWDNLDDDVKEILLRKAGDFIRATFGQGWIDRVLYMGATIPFQMANANAELALIANSGPLLTNLTRGKKSVKIGPITVEYDGNSAVQTQFVMANRMLSPLVVPSTSVNVRLIRC